MPEMTEVLARAVAAHKEGRIHEAEEGYRRVLATHPRYAEAHFMLGLVHLEKSQLPEALNSLRQAIAIDPRDARYHCNLGKALLRLGRSDDALEAFEAALVRAPEFDIALFGRGTALMDLNRAAEAERDFRAVLARHPGHAGALNNISVLLIKQNQNAEAAEILRQGLQQHPKDPWLLSNLANVLEKLNDLDPAEVAAQQALEVEPQLTGPKFSLARIAHRRGRFAEARSRLDALLTKPLSDEENLDALFELGSVLDRLGEPAAAMAAFAKANEQARESPRARHFSGTRFLERVKRNRAWFTQDSLQTAAARAASPDAPGPIFFVGFPRSGTTLMERVLQAHPGIVTTEEMSPLVPFRENLSSGGNFPDVLATLTTDDVNQATRLFWSDAEKNVGPLNGRLLVDKLPLNIVDLGLANVLFPRARVVVALRDPRDVCLSCFMQHFMLNDAMVNFLDLRQTAMTYRAVMDLWLHYREILNLPYCEYRYEDLIEDFDDVVERVLDFIGVGWHDEVARYREKSTGQAIKTPSYRDVTSARYRRAIGRWRAYRQELEPVLDELQPFITAFGYPED